MKQSLIPVPRRGIGTSSLWPLRRTQVAKNSTNSLSSQSTEGADNVGTIGEERRRFGQFRLVQREPNIPSSLAPATPLFNQEQHQSRAGPIRNNRSSRLVEALPLSKHNPDLDMASFLDANSRPNKLDELFQLPEPSIEVMEKHSWNPKDRSLNIFVKEEDPLTFHRHPVAQSTDCIRGKVGYSRGFHVWQIIWPLKQRGTHAIVGVANQNALLHKPGYSALVGFNGDSYGWDLGRNEAFHNAKETQPWKYPLQPVGERFDVPESFYCILDMDEGYLAFATEEKFLGVAFRNLHGQTLYPIVSAVWGHCEVTMRYMGSLEPEPRSLQDACRRTIRYHLGPQRIGLVDKLHLPISLRDYLLFYDRE